jgi:hypothetical protein
LKQVSLAHRVELVYTENTPAYYTTSLFTAMRHIKNPKIVCKE